MTLWDDIRLQRWIRGTVLPLTLWCQTALGCGAGISCQQDDIDSFFLPLIAASVSRAETMAIGAAPPAANAALTSGVGPTVIRPPLAALPSHPALPAMLIEQTLVAGDLRDGGTTQLALLHVTTDKDLPSERRSEPYDAIPIPPLLQQVPDTDAWTMTHIASLPSIHSWPLDRIAMRVDMRLACGACGPGGGVTRFSGSASLEMLFDDGVAGWLDNIDLAAEDGMTATGHASFGGAKAGGLVVEDHLAEMRLRIGGRDVSLLGSLLAWMSRDRTLGGALSMIPVDGSPGIGGIAGQFSGAPCPEACGVEN